MLRRNFLAGMLANGALLSRAPAQEAGAAVRLGLSYGPAARHKLDIYRPAAAAGPAPVLLFFYGGGWRSGDRAAYFLLGQLFAAEGIVTVIADYRLFPEARYPAFIQDAAKALAFVHAHI